MLDIKYIKENRELVVKALKDRNASDRVDINRAYELIEKRLDISPKLENLRADRNKISKDISTVDFTQREVLVQKATSLKTELAKLENEFSAIDKELEKLLLWIPNIPLADTPVGKDETENIEIKAWDPKKGYLNESELSGFNGSSKLMSSKSLFADTDFETVPHWEIGNDLDIIDLEAGSNLSGSRFYYLKNEAVIIMYAIFDLLMRKLIQEGFTPMIVPLLVKEHALYGSSQFPADEVDIYRIDNFNIEDEKKLYLVGSSEPSLFGYFAGKTINIDELPKKVMAISTCFRSEAGSWGKDVRGIKRTHQFDKLEMDMVVENDLQKAYEYHEYLLSINEWLLQQLKLPYHVINMCTGDLGYYAAAKKYDVEVWLSQSQEYMEVMSDSITTDYQSRRLNIRYKDKDENKYVYTLNDTGATHRLLIGIIDHYQQKDGSVVVPDVLRPYCGFDVIRKK